MNKQDKKEIMNLIKYKKMLGGRTMIKDFLDTIARNYLKSEECKRLSEEFRYASKVKIKMYNGKGKCTGKYQTINTNLLSEAFEQMSENYKDKSVKMLEHQMEANQ